MKKINDGLTPQQRWSKLHPKEVRAKLYKWRKNNREKLNTYNREWENKNKEKRTADLRKWRNEHPEIVKEWRRNSYWKHRDSILKQLREKNSELRHIVISAYGGRCTCPKCPETNSKFLTVEHVGGWGAADRKENGHQTIRLYKRLIKLGFPKTFTVKCWNCNSGAHMNGGICPHVSN